MQSPLDEIQQLPPLKTPMSEEERERKARSNAVDAAVALVLHGRLDAWCTPDFAYALYTFVRDGVPVMEIEFEPEPPKRRKSKNG